MLYFWLPCSQNSHLIVFFNLCTEITEHDFKPFSKSFDSLALQHSNFRFIPFSSYSLFPPAHTVGGCSDHCKLILRVCSLLPCELLSNGSEKASRHAPQDVCLPISKSKLNCHIVNSSQTETKENSVYQGKI